MRLNAGETELSQEGATSSRVPSSIPLDSLLPALDKHCTSLSSVLLPSLNWRSAVLGIKSPTVLLRGPKGTNHQKYIDTFKVAERYLLFNMYQSNLEYTFLK